MKILIESYYYYMSRGDNRVKSWFGMETPWLTFGFLGLYVVAIYWIKQVMSNRKQFELRHFMIIYNFFQVIASFYIFFEVIQFY